MNLASFRRSTLALLLATTCMGGSAQAMPQENGGTRGPLIQGWSLNGIQLQGLGLNGPGLVLQGRTFNGPGLVLQGKLFNGPGLVLQGKMFNGPGLVLQGRMFNGPGLVLQGRALYGPTSALASDRCAEESHGVCLRDARAEALPGHSMMSGLAAARVRVTLAAR